MWGRIESGTSQECKRSTRTFAGGFSLLLVRGSYSYFGQSPASANLILRTRGRVNRLTVISQRRAGRPGQACQRKKSGPSHMGSIRLTIGPLEAAQPKPLLEPTRSGVAPGPRGFFAHHSPRGPSATPTASAHTFGIKKDASQRSSRKCNRRLEACAWPRLQPFQATLHVSYQGGQLVHNRCRFLRLLEPLRSFHATICWQRCLSGSASGLQGLVATQTTSS